eukprot:g4498.t1
MMLSSVLTGFPLSVVVLGSDAWLAVAAVSNASLDCPCIDPWEQVASPRPRCRPNRYGLCVPLDYGSAACKKHDVGLGRECRSVVPPAWCDSEWCYVNASACTRPHAISDYFPNLTYSYHTCGYLNTYIANEHTGKLRTFTAARPLRVAFPGDSGNGYAVVTVPKGDPNGRKEGSIVRFIDRILREHKVQWEAWAVSAHSRARYSSSYTACVHDVALGRVDVCAGNFWTTSARKLLAPFTTTIYSDTFFLITHEVAHSKTIWNYIAEPFLPFEPAVWGFMILVMLYVSVAVHFSDVVIEDRNLGAPPPEPGAQASPSARSSRKPRGGQRPVPHVLERMESFFQPKNIRGRKLLAWHAKRMGKTLYQSVLGFVSGGPVMEAHSPPARVINVGFGLFVVFTLATYTASLTSRFVVRAEASGTRSLVAALDRGDRICLLQAIDSSIRTKFAALATQGVPCRDAVEMMQRMDAGDCRHALMSNDAWVNAQSGQLTGTPHCNKTKVGTSVYSISNAMPVREDLAFPLSWAIAKAMEQGWYEDEVLIAHRRFTKASRCAAIVQQSQLGRMTLGSMAGPMIFCATFSTAGLLLAVLLRARGAAKVVQDRLRRNTVTDTVGGALVERLTAIRKRSSKSLGNGRGKGSNASTPAGSAPQEIRDKPVVLGEQVLALEQIDVHDVPQNNGD